MRLHSFSAVALALLAAPRGATLSAPLAARALRPLLRPRVPVPVSHAPAVPSRPPNPADGPPRGLFGPLVQRWRDQCEFWQSCKDHAVHPRFSSKRKSYGVGGEASQATGCARQTGEKPCRVCARRTPKKRGAHLA